MLQTDGSTDSTEPTQPVSIQPCEKTVSDRPADDEEQRRVTLGMADIDHDGTDQREIDYKPVPCPDCGTHDFADTPVCEQCSTKIEDIEAEEPSIDENHDELERLVADWLRIKGPLTKDDLRNILT